MTEKPEYLEGALHKPSSQDDDDEYWAVLRKDGKWDIYASFPGAAWPKEPSETTDRLPSGFEGEILCPECGSKTQCFHRDVGGIDYDDEYTLVCLRCERRIARETRSGGTFQHNHSTTCPYCKKSYNEHTDTPKKYW